MCLNAYIHDQGERTKFIHTTEGTRLLEFLIFVNGWSDEGVKKMGTAAVCQSRPCSGLDERRPFGRSPKQGREAAVELEGL